MTQAESEPDTPQAATEEREALVKDMIAFGRLPVTTQCEGSCFGIGECLACTEACADAILAAGWRRAARPGAPPQPSEAADLLEAAWGLIANASSGDWTLESQEWQAAAMRWHDKYAARLRAGDAPEKGT